MRFDTDQLLLMNDLHDEVIIIIIANRFNDTFRVEGKWVHKIRVRLQNKFRRSLGETEKGIIIVIDGDEI